MSPVFVIIDGSSLIHRAFYALPLLTTAGGQYTNAVYGFASMLVKLIGDIKPDAVVVAFDKGRATFRREKYSLYKANRKATPPELAEQFPLTKELLDAFGIKTIEQEGYEADDIIGTMATKAEQSGYETIIVTGDRDALQLIASHTKVMLTKKGISEMELYDREVFKQKYGVEAAQLVDLKGLMGDSSDNIPGVPGIGEKTAIKLIAEFGSVENLIRNVDKVSGKKIRENIRNNAELAVLSKKLASIVCDMQIEFVAEELKLRPDIAKVEEILSRLEFKSLISRVYEVFGSNETGLEIVEDLPIPVIIATGDEVANIVTEVRNNKSLIFYPVIKGKAPEAALLGMAVANASGVVFYVPSDVENWPELLRVLADGAIKKITYNAKLVYNVCEFQQEFELAGLDFDVLIAAYLLEPSESNYPLTTLKEIYLGQRAGGQKAYTDKDEAYAVWACETVRNLYPVLRNKLVEFGLENLFNSIEIPLIKVLASMENAGIKVDRSSLEAMSVDISTKVELLLKEIYQLAGETFNVNSTKQLGSILFDKLQLPVVKKTKTGYSTDAEVLEKLAGSHPLIDKLLEYRLLTKLKSTYLDGLLPLVNTKTGRIHTSFNQTVTATGRLSSSEPNLQNIPIRTEVGRRIRELFVPGEGFDYIVSADYSQIELRILAHMSGDKSLIEAFNQNEDIHTRTASRVFGVGAAEVTSEMRARAKAVNFGIVYGISDYGLSRDIGVSRKEAGRYIDNYFAKHSGVKDFIENIINDARRLGYVTTLLGRRRYLPDINSSNFNRRSFAERTAMNTPIQGTAADIIKKAMIDVYNSLCEHNLKSRILLQVHDELVLEVPREEIDIVPKIVKTAMEQAIELDVKLIADVKLGKNWAKAK